MLVAVRTDERTFEKNEQALLEAVADYASLSLVNTRLFRTLNTSMEMSQEAEKRHTATLNSIRSAVAEDLKSAIYPIDFLLAEKTGSLSDSQRENLKMARTALQRTARTVEKTTSSVPHTLKKQ